MSPVIDIHEHIFRAVDIPLRGYLSSRHYEEKYLQRWGFIFFALIARCIRRKREGWKRGFICRKVLELLYTKMGHGYRRWADILSRREISSIAGLMLNTFDKSNIDLYVPLVIDYEYWFRNSVDERILKQVEKIRDEVIIPFGGRIHPFVPFDPVREIAYRKRMPTQDPPRTAESCSSMQMVRDAIHDWGYIGVKIYNALGYSPLGNASLDTERERIFRQIRRSRYAEITGEEIDDALRDLYAFCQEEQVPITAHCVADGIEAYPGASFDFCRPDQWRPVLEEFPDLRLNLAHFGWSDGQRYKKIGSGISDGSDKKNTWVTEIVDMLSRYENLFADVSHHLVVLADRRQEYIDDYISICSDYPGLLQRRLLFGIDWHVISRVPGYYHFKDDYIRVLDETDLFNEQDITNFLGRNAVEFLGLLPLNSCHGWNRNRVRLERFYSMHSILPPAWFTDTA